jgi:molecular chaperone DnaK (HSP70)
MSLLYLVALCYGIYKADLPEQTEKPRLVAFVDVGYTALQASIVALNKGKLKVRILLCALVAICVDLFSVRQMIATAFDLSLGGRDFDRVIMDAMREDFRKRYKVDAYSTVKARLRLRAECEKAKKSMSSNVQPMPIALESFIDEKDVSGKMSRAEFEELAKPLFDRIRITLTHLLREASKSVTTQERTIARLATVSLCSYLREADSVLLTAWRFASVCTPEPRQRWNHIAMCSS